MGGGEQLRVVLVDLAAGLSEVRVVRVVVLEGDGLWPEGDVAAGQVGMGLRGLGRPATAGGRLSPRRRRRCCRPSR